MITTFENPNRNNGTKINKEDIKFKSAKQADILYKIQINDSSSILSLENYKDNFMNHPTARFMYPYPSKNKIGRTSKHILDIKVVR